MYTVIIPIAIQQFSLYKFYSHRAAKPYSLHSTTSRDIVHVWPSFCPLFLFHLQRLRLDSIFMMSTNPIRIHYGRDDVVINSSLTS